MKQLSSKLAALALMAFAFVGCNKGAQNAPENVTNTPQDVMVRVNLAGTRAAMSDLKDKVEDQAGASVKQIDVYIVDKNAKILVAERYAKGSDDYNKLIGDGKKYINVEPSASDAIVVVNSGNDALAKGALFNDDNVTSEALRVETDEVLYYGRKALTTIGTEPQNPEPEQDKKTTVKKAEINAKALANRFQVKSAKFQKIVWKEGMKEAAKAWQLKWIEDEVKKPDGVINESTSKAEKSKAAAEAFKNLVGEYSFKTGKTTDPSKQTEWDKYFELVDVTTALKGVFLNRFNYKFDLLPEYNASDLRWAKIYNDGRYDRENGTFKPDKDDENYNSSTADDLSAVASYYAADLSSKFTENKVVAFNFFYEGITSYGLTDSDNKTGAPRIVFFFNSNKDNGVAVSEATQFFPIFGYATDEELENPLAADEVQGAKLINLDIAKLNGGRGLLVEVEDGIPVVETPGGNEQPEAEKNINAIVKVTIEQWVEKNVYPIANLPK